MCTMITEALDAAGSAKGRVGWFHFGHVFVGYDHPVHARGDHAVLLDFVSESAEHGDRVALELGIKEARQLIDLLAQVLIEAESIGDVGPGHSETRA